MKRQLRIHVAGWCLLAPAALAFTTVPGAAAAQVAAPAASTAPSIERIQVSSVGRLQPGTTLNFAVDAAPDAAAFVSLPGVPGQLHLSEVRPGHYEGRYTVRSGDRLNPQGPVVATVRSGDRVATANLAHPLATEPTPPPVISAITPRAGEIVPSAPDTVVSGRFDDHGGAAVAPDSVRILVSGRDVTSESRIDPRSFTYLGPLAPGEHTVDVMARDTDGNAVHRTWSFDVAAAAPVTMPIQILNQTDNARIDGKVAQVRARTAPYATVDVRVDAVPPVVPGTFGVARELFTRTLQADAAGNFGFTFVQPAPVPGTRYDIQMVAHEANGTNEARLTLFQGLA